jgi:ribosomal protein S18 acetylase RimI-like enzyme
VDNYIKKYINKNDEIIKIKMLEWFFAYDLVEFLSQHTIKSKDFYGVEKMIFGKIETDEIPNLMRKIYDGECLVICAVSGDNKIIGFSGVAKKTKDTGIFVVFIHKYYRNTGVGKELTSIILDYAKYINIKEVNLEVRVNNKIAISLYKKIGFSKIKVIENSIMYNNHIASQVLMSLNLNG